MENNVLTNYAPCPVTISDLVKYQTESQIDRTALIGIDCASISYAFLQQHLSTVLHTLNTGGIGRGDRVAVVLPNGPEMALAFLGVSACATCAPLNSAYQKGEFEFYLKDLDAKALLTTKDDPTPAREVARSLGIEIIEITPYDDWADHFSMSMGKAGHTGCGGWAASDDVALILHTSGTTSRPKMVPLTQSNLCTSAYNVAAALKLDEKDRCLNVMPLFHIHGLVAALLATLGSGGSVVCTPGFSDAHFFEWTDTWHPTWYTAVPTMHQAVLSQVEKHREAVKRNPFRFIRSSSSALPPQIMSQLENSFGVPVIEAYGMTEAAHQMSSNPLPPATRKPRSVGVAAGPEIAVMGEDGNLLASGHIGEIVIRGTNVTSGYEHNSQANRDAFSSGWFRTGDQGKFDAEGYLFITGRIKELINRGGEKVSPREVDEVLMDHPEVIQAVAFAVPHPTLGEDLAAAVVPKEGCTPDETELREFAARHLTNFKVPTRIILVDKIPKGPTGKPQRIGLVDRLAEGLAVEFEAPIAGSEQRAAQIFQEVIGCSRVGRKDNFFALGGDSLGATRAHSRLSEAFGIEIQPTLLFRWPTVSLIAGELDRLKEAQGVDFLLKQLEKLPEDEALQLLENGAAGDSDSDGG